MAVPSNSKSQGPDSNRSGNALQAFAWPLRHLGNWQARLTTVSIWLKPLSVGDAPCAATLEKMSSPIKIAFAAKRSGFLFSGFSAIFRRRKLYIDKILCFDRQESKYISSLPPIPETFASLLFSSSSFLHFSQQGTFLYGLPAPISRKHYGPGKLRRVAA